MSPRADRRDGDLPRTRRTRTLGARTATDPNSASNARTPWGSRTSRGTERHERTLGIPDRAITMWPTSPPVPTGAARLDDTVTDLIRVGNDTRPARPPIDVLHQAVAEIAYRAPGQPASIQNRIISRVAAGRDIDVTDLSVLAVSVGTLIARSTRQPAAPDAGRRALNALAGANIRLALETHLARQGLGTLTRHSPPDLPRLWMLANGLTHGVDALTLLSVPGTSHGPLARIKPNHDDLIDWYGAGHAADHLDTLVLAAQSGRQWIDRGDLRSSDQLGRAIGVVHLTHPGIAHELAAIGPRHLTAGTIRAAVRGLPIPDTLTDLSDQALKAACDRAGWLLGTADENTHRIIVNRTIRAGWTEDIRTRLADGDLYALTYAVAAHGPSDEYLYKATAPDVTVPAAPDATGTYLGAASRHAIAHFTDQHIPEPPSRATAIAARFPDRALARNLTLNTAELRAETPDADADPPEPPPPAETNAAPDLDDFDGLDF